MDINDINNEDFDLNEDDFEFIDPTEIEVSRRGAEKVFNQSLLRALYKAFETGEALRIKSMRVSRDDFASKAEYANEKQKASQEIRKHFTELKTQEVISESAVLKIDWAQSSGIPQARIRD